MILFFQIIVGLSFFLSLSFFHHSIKDSDPMISKLIFFFKSIPLISALSLILSVYSNPSCIFLYYISFLIPISIIVLTRDKLMPIDHLN